MRVRAMVTMLGALAVCGAAPAGASADCPGADEAPTASNLAAVSDASLCLLNGERTARGLGALTANLVLARVALAHSREMVASGTFSHDSPDGTAFDERILDAGYRSLDTGVAVGENIAWGSGSLATPRQIVTAWMASPGHRSNILARDFREAGMGVVLGTPTGEASGATYTTDFGAWRQKKVRAAPHRRRTARRAHRRAAKRSGHRRQHP
ncbi:MAG: hypothetical protein QOI78_6782 [Actinomycetota bacterium]|nr:hypothetical protein [Actinomycetota bacterium]